jgi:glycosyltransferase involved in cell wall biosynthesis
MRQPSVSILVPSFNRPGYLELAVESIRNQTFRDFKVHIQDNASSADIAAALAKFPDLPIDFVRNERTLPQTDNIAAGLARCEGEFVAVLCDDDLWQPTFLEKMVAALRRRSDCIVAFANLEIIDENGRVLQSETKRCRAFHGLPLLTSGYIEDFERVATVYRAISAFSGSVFRREAIAATRFPQDMPTVADTYLCFLAARHGNVACYCDEVLFQIRYHGGTVTAAGRGALAGRIRRHHSQAILWDAMLADRGAGQKAYYRYKRAFELLQMTAASWAAGEFRAPLAVAACHGGLANIAGFFDYPRQYVEARRRGLKRRFLP